MNQRPSPDRRDAYVHFQMMTTRWMDNDPYRHMNNTTYYSFFDTVVCQYLIENGALDIEKSPVIGLVAETTCRFFKSIAFPAKINVGLRVGHQGNSSVRYEIALFRDDEEIASAQGHFVHVYVDRVSNRPVPLPEKIQSVIAPLRSRDAEQIAAE
jgi:acyl-CoA thioester hydrolase